MDNYLDLVNSKAASNPMKNQTTDAQQLGLEIREVRKARGLTLNDLSVQVDCSVAYLSRVELGTTRLSVALLQAISKALSVESAWFFPKRTGEGILESTHVVRANNRRPLSDLYTRTSAELGFHDELLPSTLSGKCYLMKSSFPAEKGAQPDCTDNNDGYAYEGEQHGIVTSGEVLLILGTERIILKSGDSFSYPTTIPHKFINNSDKEATMIYAMAPVRISW